MSQVVSHPNQSLLTRAERPLDRRYFTAGRRKICAGTMDLLAGACLLASLRCNGFPSIEHDILKHCFEFHGRGVKRLTNFMRKISVHVKAETGKNPTPPTVAVLIPRFCNDLEKFWHANIPVKIQSEMECFAVSLVTSYALYSPMLSSGLIKLTLLLA